MGGKDDQNNDLGSVHEDNSTDLGQVRENNAKQPDNSASKKPTTNEDLGTVHEDSSAKKASPPPLPQEPKANNKRPFYKMSFLTGNERAISSSFFFIGAAIMMPIFWPVGVSLIGIGIGIAVTDAIKSNQKHYLQTDLTKAMKGNKKLKTGVSNQLTELYLNDKPKGKEQSTNQEQTTEQKPNIPDIAGNSLPAAGASAKNPPALPPKPERYKGNPVVKEPSLGNVSPSSTPKVNQPGAGQGPNL